MSKLLTVAYMLFSLSSAFAAGVRVVDEEIRNPHVIKMTAKEQWAYLFIKRTCLGQEGLAAFYSDRALTALSASSSMWTLKFKEMGSYVENYGVSSLTKDILTSRSLGIALSECYPHSSMRRKAYLAELISLDAAGTFAGTVTGTLGVWKTMALAGGYVWGRVSTKLAARGMGEAAIKRLGIAIPVVAGVVPAMSSYKAEEKEYRARIEASFNQLYVELNDLVKMQKEIERDIKDLGNTNDEELMEDILKESKENLGDIQKQCSKILNDKDLTKEWKNKIEPICQKYK